MHYAEEQRFSERLKRMGADRKCGDVSARACMLVCLCVSKCVRGPLLTRGFRHCPSLYPTICTDGLRKVGITDTTLALQVGGIGAAMLVSYFMARKSTFSLRRVRLCLSGILDPCQEPYLHESCTLRWPQALWAALCTSRIRRIVKPAGSSWRNLRPVGRNAHRHLNNSDILNSSAPLPPPHPLVHCIIAIYV